MDEKRYDDIDLSIIVPAYNEQARLPVMMKDTLAYLNKNTSSKGSRFFKRVEFVIVNDGSKDGTGELIREYTAKHTMDQDVIVRGISLL